MPINKTLHDLIKKIVIYLILNRFVLHFIYKFYLIVFASILRSVPALRQLPCATTRSRRETQKTGSLRAHESCAILYSTHPRTRARPAYVYSCTAYCVDKLYTMSPEKML